MIDVIIADNTRPACGGPQLIRYSAGGVYLALAQKGFDARYIDLMTDAQKITTDLPEESSADVYCYAVFFGNKVNAFHHMQETRRMKKSPHLIIAFGPFASVFSDEILSRGLADIVVADDPEFVIPMILQEKHRSASLSAIPNLSYMHEGTIIHTPKHSFHHLDEIPFISPHLYDQGHRPAVMMTARGCQYHCVYCDRNVLWGGGVRHRSVENVLKEIKELVEVHHVQRIHFLDEDIAADQKRLVALCEGMRRIKGEFDWMCSACVNSVNQKILLLMGGSRCRRIDFGVESASVDVLRRIGKMYGREDILNAVRWAQEAGLRVEVNITIGNPDESDADRNLTLSVLKELGPSVAITTNRLVILPGTAFFRKGLREGWFTQRSFFEDEGLVFYDEKRRV